MVTFPTQDAEFREGRRAVANSKLAEYRRQCHRLAGLARLGVVDKVAAVDLMYEVALCHALVRAMGDDPVQDILAEAFADADFVPLRSEVA